MLHLMIFSCNFPSVFAIFLYLIFIKITYALIWKLKCKNVFMCVFLNMNVMLLLATFHSKSNQFCFETDVTEVLVVRAGEFSLKVSS